jgi:hypothetical protein
MSTNNKNNNKNNKNNNKNNLRDRTALKTPEKYKDNESKKSARNKKSKITNDLHCEQCGVIIDNINYFHYIWEDDFGKIDVCGNCFNNLTYYDNSIPSIPSFQNTIPSQNLPNKDTNQPLNIEPIVKPKISLIFITGNKPKNNNKDNGDNKDDKDDKDGKDDKDDKNDRDDMDDKDDKDDKDDRDDRDDRDDSYERDDRDDRDANIPNLVNANNKNKHQYKIKKSNNNINASGCNDGCDPNNDSGLMFFQQILNQLHNIDATSTSSNGFGFNNNNKNKNNSNLGTDAANDADNEEDYNNLEYEWLGDGIKTIDDLIALGKTYDCRKRKRYNLNLKQLNRLVEPLCELRDMIGMTDVKKIIFDQLIYYLQNLDDKNVDMLHTVITGPPGVGKTQLTHIIAKIYNRLGFLKTDKVICAKRDDLIAEYIGQTAPKTRKVLERALGGVLLLDEIYSLTPTSDRDFAREAIDMINMYLSEHAHDLVCVVAGYKKPTYEKFFGQNEGLARRFTHHFEIKGYDSKELTLIFKKYLESQKWLLGASIEEVADIIKLHMEIFPNFGGDMMTLFACCKKAHSRRLLVIPTEVELNAIKKKIQKSDILEAVKIFKEIKEKHSSSQEEDKEKYMHMYT